MIALRTFLTQSAQENLLAQEPDILSEDKKKQKGPCPQIKANVWHFDTVKSGSCVSCVCVGLLLTYDTKPVPTRTSSATRLIKT